MRSGISGSATATIFSSLSFKPKPSCNSNASSLVNPRTLCSFKCIRFSQPKASLRRQVLRNSSTGPGGYGSGENESKSVLDAFFLGKALAEALNERIESTVGELLSTIGRLQSEQQKQVQDFQEEILERAKRAKEKAAREALEAQGIVTKSTTVKTTPVTNGVVSASSSPTTACVSSVDQPSVSEQSPSTDKAESDVVDQDAAIGIPNED